MKIATHIGLVLGLCVMIGLVLWEGLGSIWALLAGFGWSLLLLPLVWAPCLVPAALSWRLLFQPGREPPLRRVLHAIWIGRAVNTLLPSATIGGEVVKARLLHIWGVAGSDASASVLVDKSVQVIALIGWGVIGVSSILVLSLETDLLWPIVVGLLALTGGTIGFVLVQRAGMFGRATGLASTVFKSQTLANLHTGAGEADATVRAVYGRPWRVALACAYKLAGLVVQVSEVWLGAYLLGVPIGFVEALMIKSLTSTLSDVAFFIPNAYGVQEGGFVLFGGLLGQPPDVMLALSLATRLRELIIDVPGLLAWQREETRLLLDRGEAADQAG